MQFVRTPVLVKRFALAVEAEYRRRRATGSERRGEKAPVDWRTWLTTLFPTHFYHPLGGRHVEFWQWVLAIKPGIRPRPFIGVWPRGSGKSTSAEVACVALGVRGRRRYGLYVRETQDMADKSVENIAALLESRGIERHYPDHSERKVGKYGNQRGWRRNRLWTNGGLVIDALGLDTASRGLKAEDQRPDFFVLDDIDGKHDSIATTAKKVETLTHSILPAGSRDAAVLGIQNLIIPGGVFTQLADGTADWLVDRIVSGPFPAIDDFDYEWVRDPHSGIRFAQITKGTPTWEGQSIEACQDQIKTFGLAAFVKECQHDVKKKGLGVVLRMKPSNLVDMSDDDCRELLALRTGFGGIDFQLARFAFVLFAIDAANRAVRIDEYFSQFEGLRARAQAIHGLCEHYGLEPESRMLPIWADSANPQDIMELNSHFRDGWDVTEERTGEVKHVVSKLRCVGVSRENKLRRVAVERINDALDRNMLLYRTGIEYDWFLGRTSTNEGTPMFGSRLLWEADNWSLPKTRAGEAQDENPDDNTADGGDFMAAQRYALMSRWRKAKFPTDFGVYENDRLEPFDYPRKSFIEPPHAIDTVEDLPPALTAKLARLERRVHTTQPARRQPLVRAPKLLGEGGRLTRLGK